MVKISAFVAKEAQFFIFLCSFPVFTKTPCVMNASKNIFPTLFLLLASFTLLHHGWANYDQETLLDYTSVIDEPVYENPHCTMKITHEYKEWLVILAPATRMKSRGITA